MREFTPEVLASRTFVISMIGVCGFIAVVFLFIL